MKNKLQEKDYPDWVAVHVPVNASIAEGVINYLIELGSSGCEEFSDKVVAYFSHRHFREQFPDAIKNYFLELSSLGFELLETEIVVKPVKELNWETIWKQNFKPIMISDKIAVKPTWEKLPASFRGVVIEIDPKQAFGTGSHATTRIALQFVEKYFKENQTVLDVGTGTGILAIAAVKLGARQVVALDFDAVAVTAAKENFQQNSVGPECKLFVGELNALAPTGCFFDLILANINRIEILKLLNDFHRLLNCSGHLVLTGLLREEKEEVSNNISKYPNLKIVEENEQEDWIGFAIKKETLN